MDPARRQLYSSANGDRWFLVRDGESGQVFVRHEPNLPSGGNASTIEIGTFLSQGPRGPEHQALLGLIGSLVDNEGPTPQARSGKSQRRLRPG